MLARAVFLTALFGALSLGLAQGLPQPSARASIIGPSLSPAYAPNSQPTPELELLNDTEPVPSAEEIFELTASPEVQDERRPLAPEVPLLAQEILRVFPPREQCGVESVIASVAGVEVYGCTDEQVFVGGRGAGALREGQVLFSGPPNSEGPALLPESVCTERCSVLVRTILSKTIAAGWQGTACPSEDTCFMLDTRKSSLGELYEEKVAELFQVSGLGRDTQLEPDFGNDNCTAAQSISSRALDLTNAARQFVGSPGGLGSAVTSLALQAFFPSEPKFETKEKCAALWIKEGTCAFENPFFDGASNCKGGDCYYCKGEACDNGCGGADETNPIVILLGGLVTKSTWTDFNFACCSHDFCYSSGVAQKAFCDRTFLKDMLRSCNIGSWTVRGDCYAIAHLVYFALQTTQSDVAYSTAIEEQKAYLSTGCMESPTPTPVSPVAGDGVEASLFTDPHLRTFDGLSFDCQATGEFILVQATPSGPMIRGRFSGPTTSGSVTTGLVASEPDAPKVQFSIAAPSETGVSELFRGCPLRFYIDGASQALSSTPIGGSGGQVDFDEVGKVQVVLPSGTRLAFRVTTSPTFGCFFESFTVRLPRSIISSKTVTGLLGTPNQDPTDDWNSADGMPIELPSSRGLVFEQAYNYCTQNWCVSDEADSMFVYDSGSSFAAFNKCNAPYEAQVDLTSASPALQDLCAGNVACLVDGLVTGNNTDAALALEVQAGLDASGSVGSPLKFEPAVVLQGAATNVRVEVDVSSDGLLSADVEAYNVYRIDATSGKATGVSVLTLVDDGAVSSSDDVAGDKIFHNELAVQPAVGEAELGFIARPVIGGVESTEAGLVFTALSGVRAYSAASGLISTIPTGTATTANVDSLEGLVLDVAFSWPTDQRDLDTGTEFLSETVGFGCESKTDFSEWFADNTSAGGTERSEVKLGASLAAGEWAGSTTVTLRAGWYNSSNGTGPATARMALRRAATGEVLDSTALGTAISPGTQSGCAEQVVAVLTVVVGEDGAAALTLAADGSA